MIDRSQVFGIEALAQWERELGGEDSTNWGMPSFDFTDWWLEARHHKNAQIYSDSLAALDSFHMCGQCNCTRQLFLSRYL